MEQRPFGLAKTKRLEINEGFSNWKQFFEGAMRYLHHVEKTAARKAVDNIEDK